MPRAGLDFNAQRRAVLDNHVARTSELAAAVRAGTVPKPVAVIWPENSSDIDPLVDDKARGLIQQAVDAVVRATGLDSASEDVLMKAARSAMASSPITEKS